MQAILRTGQGIYEGGRRLESLFLMVNQIGSAAARTNMADYGRTHPDDRLLSSRSTEKWRMILINTRLTSAAARRRLAWPVSQHVLLDRPKSSVGRSESDAIHGPSWNKSGVYDLNIRNRGIREPHKAVEIPRLEVRTLGQ